MCDERDAEMDEDPEMAQWSSSDIRYYCFRRMKHLVQHYLPMKRDPWFHDIQRRMNEEGYHGELLDLLPPNYVQCEILFVGINPSPEAVRTQQFYGSKTNHFWKCFKEAEFVPKEAWGLQSKVEEMMKKQGPRTGYESLSSFKEILALSWNIGFCNFVPRPTSKANDIEPSEFKEHWPKLYEKIRVLRPKVVVFNGSLLKRHIPRGVVPLNKVGLGIHPNHVNYSTPEGKLVGMTIFYVMPSSSALGAEYPTWLHKLPFFKDVRVLRDELNHGNAAKVKSGYRDLKAPYSSP